MTGTLAATAAVALTVVGPASADATSAPDNVTVATAVDALGNQVVDTIQTNGFIYDRTRPAGGGISGPGLRVGAPTTAVSLTSRPYDAFVLQFAENGNVYQVTSTAPYVWTDNRTLGTGLGTVNALASTSRSDGSVVVNIVADKGIYTVSEMANGDTVAPFLLDTTPTTAVALTTLPNGDIRQESIQGGQLVERTLTSDGWGAKTVISTPLAGLTSVATTTQTNGDQLIDVIDQNGRVYELNHTAAGATTGPYLLNENTGATSVALSARPNGDAVQEVVNNHQLTERVRHNGLWGPGTVIS
ncbi:hypothetical protein [Kutzneria sp. NPDC052558]|uniref:hypothetical protein n=1 Tax=Kutzneria sp. NPDC052558 TaxID=3364121 RepID=UPI0037CAF35B